MKFMPYADDTIWLLFALGLMIVVADAVLYAEFGLDVWAFLGFLITGILVCASFYIVGTHSPIGTAPPTSETPVGNYLKVCGVCVDGGRI